MSLENLSQPPETVLTSHHSETDTIVSRRRPGRSESMSPYLIPLLRNTETAHLPSKDFQLGEPRPETNDLAPAMGIAVGLALAVPLWAIISAAVWALIR